MTDPATRIYVGALVTYHGSLDDLHGRTFLAVPCQWRCEDRCRLDSTPARLGLLDPNTGTRLDHVRETSIRPADYEWPADGVPMWFGSHWYMGAYTTSEGCGEERTLHFYTAEKSNPYGETYFHWGSDAPDGFLDKVRRLDRQGISHHTRLI